MSEFTATEVTDHHFVSDNVVDDKLAAVYPGDDKLKEECGVAAIYGHPEASKLAYLSLYALQHRGQESAGISSSDGTQIVDGRLLLR